MYDEVPSSSSYSSMSPVETWIKALTQPKEEAYLEIVNDPGASVGKAVVWLAVAGLIGGLITGIINGVFGVSAFSQFSQYTDFDMPRAAGGFMSVISGAFGGIIGALIGAFLITGLVQVVAKMLGGTGTFEKLFYGYAAYYAPLGLVTSVLGAIPFVNCLTLPLGIYGLVLMVIANKAVHRYDTGKAVISSLAPLLVIFLFCCCIVVVFGSIFGAAFGSGFDGILNNMMP